MEVTREVDEQGSEDTTDGLGHEADIVHPGRGSFCAGDTGHLGAQPGRAPGWSRMGSGPRGAARLHQLQLCVFVDWVVSNFNNHAQCCHEMP